MHGLEAGWVRFSPFADPKDISRLTELNFSCITRWDFCTEQADIMPTAWKQRQDEMSDHVQNRFYCTPAIIRVLSREAERVVLARVIRLEHQEDGAEVRVRQVPDGVPHYADEWQERAVRIPDTNGVRAGTQFLVLDDPVCPAAPATEENLKAARQDATEAWINPVHPLGLPFGTLKPPDIDLQ